MPTPTAHVALVTAAAMAELDDDLGPLAGALRERGLAVATPAWDDEAVDWSAFDLAVLRSPWDYMDRRQEFLAWLDRTAAATDLRNPPAVVRWSTDKRYLLDLAAAGVPVVPTAVVEPGSDPSAAIGRLAAQAERGHVVVKPVVGVGSRDAARHSSPAAAGDHAAALLAQGRAVLVQPYLDAVDVHGETAVVLFRGRCSHALRKAALLRADAAPTTGPFAVEELAARPPSDGELAVAHQALAATADHLGPSAARLLYARVDLLEGPAGPVVLELELAEPSFFVALAPGAAERFADAVVAELAGTARG